MHPCQTIAGGFSKNACILWLSYINPTTRYFEWGSGSTTRIADKIAMRVTSIEGSHSWYKKMMTHNFSKNTNLMYVDIGPTKMFSWPLQKNNTKKSQAYVNAINSTQDIILVDGRWRVACAIASFPFIESNGRLLLHDFGRKEYHTLLKFYEKEKEIEELVVLRKKTNVSQLELRKHKTIFMNNALR